MEVQILETPTLATFFLMMFVSIYLFAYFLVFRNWPEQHRREASSCLISLAHGTPVVFMATFAILCSPNPQHSTFASPNTASQNTVLEYSIAYFLMDLLHYLLFFPGAVVFIVHHLGSLYVLLTCRYAVNHGASAILVVLVLAEVTSACQNVWSLARLKKGDVPAAAKLYEYLSFPFYGIYSVVRGILAPFFVHKMGVFYLTGAADGLIPRWAWCSWMVVIVIGVSVSIPWVLSHWKEWYRERSRRVQRKAS